MTQARSPSMAQILRKAAHEFITISGEVLHRLMRLQLPSLLAFCLACALFITILPLAISLFVGFLVCKLILFLVAPSPDY